MAQVGPGLTNQVYTAVAWLYSKDQPHFTAKLLPEVLAADLTLACTANSSSAHSIWPVSFGLPELVPVVSPGLCQGLSTWKPTTYPGSGSILLVKEKRGEHTEVLPKLEYGEGGGDDGISVCACVCVKQT
jgi:hypothetical protein